VASLFNAWVMLALRAVVTSGQLSLDILAGPTLEWNVVYPFTGPTEYGARIRIGAALSGGRGIEMTLVDMMMWNAILPKETLRALMGLVRPRVTEVQEEEVLESLASLGRALTS
jgi:hypothetical protein